MKFLFCLIFLTASAEGRVFDFKKESFGAVIGGLVAPSKLGTQAYSASAGNDVTYDRALTYDSGGEFGFIYGLGSLRLRFGFEFFKPPSLKGLIATNTAGAQLYTLNSEVLAYMPKLGIEISLRETSNSRFYVLGDFGAASFTLKNEYAFTSTGSSTYSGLADFSEELKGSGTSIDGALGVEILAFDTTSVSFEAGYRSLAIGNLAHTKDSTGFQGAVLKGAAATNTDGTNRSLALSNYYGKILFHFWIN